MKLRITPFNRREAARRDLITVQLDGADLSFVNFSNSCLVSASLRGANLHHANLLFADLAGADLRGADLSCADLRWADLRGARLEGANLAGAHLCGADLRGADVRNINAWRMSYDYKTTQWSSNMGEVQSSWTYLAGLGASPEHSRNGFRSLDVRKDTAPITPEVEELERPDRPSDRHTGLYFDLATPFGQPGVVCPWFWTTHKIKLPRAVSVLNPIVTNLIRAFRRNIAA